MSSRRQNVVRAVALALVVSAIQPAAAQREGRKAPDLTGRVYAISDDGKVLTLASSAGRGEEPKKTDFTLTDKFKIEFTGVFKDMGRKLKVGDSVAVYQEMGVVQVTAAPDVHGKITAVAKDGTSITVEKAGPGRDGTTPVEIKLTDKTRKVTQHSRDGSDAPEHKPEVGHSASVWFQEGSKNVAIAVQVFPPSQGGGRR